MTKITMDLSGTFTVTKGSRKDDWEAEAAVDLSAIPESLWPELAKHGLKQKIADAASQAKTLAEATAMMQKAIDALLKGEWSTRGEGIGLRGVAVLRLFKLKLSADETKRFNKLSASDQVRKALENADAFGEETIAAKIAEIEAERKANAEKREAEKQSLAAINIKIDF